MLIYSLVQTFFDGACTVYVLKAISLFCVTALWAHLKFSNYTGLLLQISWLIVQKMTIVFVLPSGAHATISNIR